MNDCRNLITAPPRDSSMFFTGLRSNSEINIAKGYAESHGLAHVSRAYPTGFTNLLAYEDSPDALAQFQRNYMQVFAEKSSGTAFLMLLDDTTPAADSIFSTIELPALEHAAQVDKIFRLSFANPPEDPTTSKETIWTKASDAVPYATGICTVHFTHYMIPKDGTAYSLEATIFDGLGNLLGHQPKIDASEPVSVASKLPSALQITLVKPGYKFHPDNAVIQFRLGDVSWASDSIRCSVGKVWHGNRDGDCQFDC